ncbi:MAG: SDR family oxidoreductase [Elusimicrobia bacterium]|nr:SDR family oxidoreductase [Elusimicrobiota bacterium]
MKVALFGARGYLGGRIAAHLTEEGHDVIAVSRRPGPPPPWLKVKRVLAWTGKGAERFRQALGPVDAALLLSAPNEIDAARNPVEALQVGGEWTWATLDLLAHLPPPRVLFFSTFHVYGAHARGVLREDTPPAPGHPYALGRYLGECVADYFRSNKGLPVLRLRLSNAMGAPADVSVPRWSLLFNDLCDQVVRTGKIVLKSPGNQKRNFITLEDTARAVSFLLRRPKRWPDQGLLHVGHPRAMTLREAAESVAGVAQKIWGVSVPVEIPAMTPRAPSWTFSVQRLQRMGFSWRNRIEWEIESTLRLCRRSFLGKTKIPISR